MEAGKGNCHVETDYKSNPFGHFKKKRSHLEPNIDEKNTRLKSAQAE